MATEIIKLNKLKDEVSSDEFSSLLTRFKCTRNKDSEYFLRKIATRHDNKDISRTYLMMDTDELKIMGYFTLALKCLNLDKTDLKPDLVELMNLNEGIAQSYLLGQLARSDEAEKGSGKAMLNKALDSFTEGKNMFGCHMVRLDCRDELIDYYTGLGFQHIRKNHEKNLNQMAKFI